MIGSQVSHYRLVRKLGAGTFGEVYEGEHVHDPELRVAVKLVTPSLADEARFVEALKGECRKLDKMDHPGIVRFRELVMGDRVAMVLELLEGQDLEGRLSRGPVGVDTTVAILESALEALAYAHARGVLHRDIKPSNIFGCDDGRIKLLDFGIARAADGAQATRTGQLVGTLDYMAPERFTGEGGTASSDVYAMGLVAWELLTGVPACPDAELGAKMGWHVLTGIGDVRAARPDCPPWLAEVVSALAAREAANRPVDGTAALALVRERRAAAARSPATLAPAPATARRASPTEVAPVKGMGALPPRLASVPPPLPRSMPPVPPVPPALAGARAATPAPPPAPVAAPVPAPAPRKSATSNVVLWVALAGGTLAILCAVAGDAAYTLYKQGQAPPEVDDHFVELLQEKHAEDATGAEGGAPPAAEGKIGKMDVAKGEKVQLQKQQLDREIAENAGVLGALRDDPGAGTGDPGGTAEGLGGLGIQEDPTGSASGTGAGAGTRGGTFGSPGEAGTGTVGGDPIILGALDKSLIDAVIKRNMPQIRYCYQRELTTHPGLGGKIIVKFVIARDGTVSSATTKSSTMGNPAVESCLNGRFMRFQFPEPKGGGIVIVSYPFVFSPG